MGDHPIIFCESDLFFLVQLTRKSIAPKSSDSFVDPPPKFMALPGTPPHPPRSVIRHSRAEVISFVLYSGGDVIDPTTNQLPLVSWPFGAFLLRFVIDAGVITRNNAPCHPAFSRAAFKYEGSMIVPAGQGSDYEDFKRLCTGK